MKKKKLSRKLNFKIWTLEIFNSYEGKNILIGAHLIVSYKNSFGNCRQDF